MKISLKIIVKSLKLLKLVGRKIRSIRIKKLVKESEGKNEREKERAS